jgi:hypothetical protein
MGIDLYVLEITGGKNINEKGTAVCFSLDYKMISFGNRTLEVVVINSLYLI